MASVALARLAAALTLLAASAAAFAAEPMLDSVQAQAFRAWFVRIVGEQLRQGPTPRWNQKDCAGLVRYAVHEALRPHDAAWRRASGLSNRYLPPEVLLSPGQETLGKRWKLYGGRAAGPFVTALGLIQENSVFVAKDLNQAAPGDLLFFDQGQDQHLMIWTGDYIAYHRGSVGRHDNGLRAVAPAELMHWQDTRWQPTIDNPNFIGVFRFSFLPR